MAVARGDGRRGEGDGMNQCGVSGCVGPVGYNGYVAVCDRHTRDRDAPPMKVTCECVEPDMERLAIYGAYAAQCRRCGSPIEGTLLWPARR